MEKFEDDLWDELDENPTLKSLVKLIGLENVAKISAYYGGTRFYIAQNPMTDSKLVRMIGLDNARRLALYYPQAHVDVPVNLGKKYQIYYYLEKGYSVTEIARIVQCSRSNIYKVRDHGEFEDAQLDFFL
jgi:Mor family transcriptional regulator